MSTASSGLPSNVRSVFISDVHLGCKHSQAEEFLAFLNQYRPEYLYIVGDFIDGWKLKRRWRWSPVYDAILKHLLALRESGTRLIYTPGNHDAFLRDFLDHLGIVRIVDVRDQAIHVTADDRRLLVTHGDQFDEFEKHAPWLSYVSAFAYDVLLTANALVNRLRGAGDDPYAFCNLAKRQVKQLVQHVSRFEAQWVECVLSHRCDGIVCGHIHSPRIIEMQHAFYCNTGDWVENCTGLIERADGTLDLVRRDGTLIGRKEARPVAPEAASALPPLSIPAIDGILGGEFGLTSSEFPGQSEQTVAQMLAV